VAAHGSAGNGGAMMSTVGKGATDGDPAGNGDRVMPMGAEAGLVKTSRNLNSTAQGVEQKEKIFQHRSFPFPFNKRKYRVLEQDLDRPAYRLRLITNAKGKHHCQQLTLPTSSSNVAPTAKHGNNFS